MTAGRFPRSGPRTAVIPEAEPGCAVLAAIDAGTLDVERIKRWRKLPAEEARNTENLAERRTR